MAKQQKLCQVIGLTASAKAAAKKTTEEAYHAFAKSDLFSGLNRTFHVTMEGEPPRPTENKNPQQSVKNLLAAVRRDLTGLFDVLATQDAGNCKAKADIVVDDKVLVKDVPVTTLLWLDKQVTDLTTVVSKLPLRDGAETWTPSAEVAGYVGETRKNNVTVKRPEVLVKYQHTPEHPAQTELIHKDVTVGYWEAKVRRVTV